MNNIISQTALKSLRARYTPGARVELVSMSDPYTNLKPGDRGEVITVDVLGTVHIQWDNGSTLGAAYGADVVKLAPIPMSDKVVEEILTLRTLPDCPNMFDLNAVQRLALDNGLYELVHFIETSRKEYAHFILTGERL